MLKKIVTMSLATIMATSAMAISASAKTVIPLEEGAIMTIYEPGEYVKNTRAVSFPFSCNVAVHPLFSYVGYQTGGRTYTDFDMAGYGTEIVLEFDGDNEYDYGYQGLYNVTTGRYLTDPNGDNLGPYTSVGSTITFSNLFPSHVYKVMLSTTERGIVASGTVTID